MRACGKSTPAHSIVGLHRSTAGVIRYKGEIRPMQRTSAQQRAIQTVFQDLYSSLADTSTELEFHPRRVL